MSRELQALLEAFDHLPAEEKHAFAEEVLRRSLPFDSGTLSDEEIGSASAAALGMPRPTAGTQKNARRDGGPHFAPRAKASASVASRSRTSSMRAGSR